MLQTKDWTSILSTEQIRAHFPALLRVHNNHPVAYFDGPGGTQVPSSVAEAIVDYLYHHNANTHWAYPTSEETDAALENSRQVLADLFNASSREIVFGANMTSLTLHLSRALGTQWNSGDEIVVTELDHHANIDPWRRLETERGVLVRFVRMIPETGQIDWQSFEDSLSPRTRLFAVGAASNALGTVNEIIRATRLARDVGALIFIDAVHYAPHALIDVQALDCDFLCISAYKLYGPHIGVLFGKHDLLQSVNFPRLIPAPDLAPENAETGTQNHEGIVGAAAAVVFLASLAKGASRRQCLQVAYAELHSRSSALTTVLWEGLDSISGVRLYGPPPSLERTPTVAFTVKGVTSTDVARHLAARGLFVSHGDFYAATVIERLGLVPEGLVRVGCACYTTAEEIQRLLHAVDEIATS